MEVAERVGVSPKTVSRVINGERWVAPETVAAVRQAIDELGYRANGQASSLRRKGGLTHSIGLLVGGVDSPAHGAALIRGVETVANERGFTLLINSLGDDEERERRIVETFINRRVDGLILTSAAAEQSYLTAEISHGTPVVFIDSVPTGIIADAVVSDSRAGVLEGTWHLIERGHRRIAYFGVKEAVSTIAARHEGFVQAIGEAGIPLDFTPIRTGLTEEESTRAAIELLRGPHPPSAIFSGHFQTTIGVIRALQQESLSRSVALIGFDDLGFGDLLDPGVTVVAQDPGRIGSQASELVFNQLGGQAASGATYLIPTRLISRGSGEIRPPAEDPRN